MVVENLRSCKTWVYLDAHLLRGDLLDGAREPPARGEEPEAERVEDDDADGDDDGYDGGYVIYGDCLDVLEEFDEL